MKKTPEKGKQAKLENCSDGSGAREGNQSEMSLTSASPVNSRKASDIELLRFEIAILTAMLEAEEKVMNELHSQNAELYEKLQLMSSEKDIDRSNQE